MLNYSAAEQLFQKKKQQKFIGVYLRHNVWLNYEGANNRFAVNYVHSRYVEDVREVTDRNGNLIKQPYSRMATVKERDKWSMRPVAYIYPDRVELWKPEGFNNNSTNTANTIFSSYFDFHYTRNPSKKQDGIIFNQWMRATPQKPSYFIEHKTKRGITIYNDGRVEPDSQVGERTFSKPEQKELNQLIASVRRIVKLRAKLGALQIGNHQALHAEMCKKYGSYWEAMKPEVLCKIVAEVDPENIDTIDPLIWLISYKAGWSKPKIDYGVGFDRLINSNKEALRVHLGVISYVPQGDTQCQNKSSHGATPDSSTSSSASSEPSSSTSTESQSQSDLFQKESSNTPTIEAPASTPLLSSMSAVA